MSAWKLDPNWTLEQLEWELRMIAENLVLEEQRYDRLKREAKSVEYQDNWIQAKSMAQTTWASRRKQVEDRIVELSADS